MQQLHALLTDLFPKAIATLVIDYYYGWDQVLKLSVRLPPPPCPEHATCQEKREHFIKYREPWSIHSDPLAKSFAAGITHKVHEYGDMTWNFNVDSRPLRSPPYELRLRVQINNRKYEFIFNGDKVAQALTCGNQRKATRRIGVVDQILERFLQHDLAVAAAADSATHTDVAGSATRADV